MDTNISVFQHENVVKHIHNAHKVFELLDRLFVQLEVFFPSFMPCCAIVSERALRSLHSIHIKRHTNRKRERNCGKKQRKKSILSTSTQRNAQIYVSYLLISSGIVYFHSLAVCSNNLRCSVHIIFVVYAICHLVLHQIPGHRIL